jgi:hypothetical protein
VDTPQVVVGLNLSFLESRVKHITRTLTASAYLSRDSILRTD